MSGLLIIARTTTSINNTAAMRTKTVSTPAEMRDPRPVLVRHPFDRNHPGSQPPPIITITASRGDAAMLNDARRRRCPR
jgi:hypothetical protein